MKTSAGMDRQESSDDLFRAQLSALGYPGFAHVAKACTRTRPDNLLMTVLAQPDADARVVEALPWVVASFKNHFDFGAMVRQAKLQNLQNRLGFVLQVSAVDTPGGLTAILQLDRAQLLQEDTLRWDSMPAATREWIRANRTPLAEHWNVLTRLRAEDAHHTA
jgi:hypothetical protein